MEYYIGFLMVAAFDGVLVLVRPIPLFPCGFVACGTSGLTRIFLAWIVPAFSLSLIIMVTSWFFLVALKTDLP